MQFCEPDEHIWDFKNIFNQKIHINNFDWSVIHKLYPRGVDPRDKNAEFKVNTFAMVESCLNCNKERISIYTPLEYVYSDDPGWNYYYPQKVKPVKEISKQSKKPEGILKKINMKNIDRGINAFNKAIQDFGISMNQLSKEFDSPKTDDSAKNKKNLEKIYGLKKQTDKIWSDSLEKETQKTKDEINLEKIWGKKNQKKKDYGFNTEDVFDI